MGIPERNLRPPETSEYLGQKLNEFLGFFNNLMQSARASVGPVLPYNPDPNLHCPQGLQETNDRTTFYFTNSGAGAITNFTVQKLKAGTQYSCVRGKTRRPADTSILDQAENGFYAADIFVDEDGNIVDFSMAHPTIYGIHGLPFQPKFEEAHRDTAPCHLELHHVFHDAYGDGAMDLAECTLEKLLEEIPALFESDGITNILRNPTQVTMPDYEPRVRTSPDHDGEFTAAMDRCPTQTTEVSSQNLTPPQAHNLIAVAVGLGCPDIGGDAQIALESLKALGFELRQFQIADAPPYCVLIETHAPSALAHGLPNDPLAREVSFTHSRSNRSQLNCTLPPASRAGFSHQDARGVLQTANMQRQCSPRLPFYPELLATLRDGHPAMGDANVFEWVNSYDFSSVAPLAGGNKHLQVVDVHEPNVAYSNVVFRTVFDL